MVNYALFHRILKQSNKGNNACRFVKNVGATLLAYFAVQHLHPISFPSTAEIKSKRSRASIPLKATMVWTQATLSFPLHRKSSE